MAHLPTLPDPTPRRIPHGQKSADENDSQFSFKELTKLLGQNGAGASSEDLALDLLLHEVVSEACSTTNAAGAAIALRRGNEFICRATSGKHAPDLGSHLSAETGLSGICIQSRTVQRCDDTEVDRRVDAAACRRLGVRCLVVVPLLQGTEALGLLEVFSPHAHVFTDADVKTLNDLSQKVLDTTIPPVEKENEVEPPILRESFELSEMVAQPRRDPWTVVLAVLIVGLALLVGWMLGHRSLRKISERANASLPDPVAMKSSAQANETSTAAKTVSPGANAEGPAVTTTGKAPATNPGGLTVYENGKLVFQLKSAPTPANSIAVEVSPNAANSLLMNRVEPQYPEAARLAHIQGPVVLQVDVNEKGTVQQLRSLSGDPQLVNAAVDAVKQWRFKPYAPRGEALNFQTKITVEFKLP